MVGGGNFLTSGLGNPGQSGALAGVFTAALTPPPNSIPVVGSNSSGSGAEDPLKLGGLVFENFTAPEEFATGLQKAYAIHDFPGGDREVQEWGDFLKPIRWSGLLLGEDAEDRSNMIETLMKKKSSKVLEWRGYRVDVIIVDYTAKRNFRTQYEYEIEVVPFRAQNASSSGGKFNQPEAIVQWSFEQALQAYSAINTPFELADSKAKIVDLKDLIDQNLRQSNGKVGDIDPNIRLLLGASLAAINIDLSNLVRTGAPGIASKAADIRTYMRVVQNTLTDPEKDYREIRYINPNLPLIASEQYGDPTLWRIIAEAQKPKLQDQFLIGEYLLRIPLNPLKKPNTQPTY